MKSEPVGGGAQEEAPAVCKYGDTTCPCPDGDACHYEGADGWLLPCPFCGGPAEMGETDDSANFIECHKCGASSNLQYSLKEDGRPDLVARWNKRTGKKAVEEEAPSPATDAQREKLTTVNSRELYIRAKLYTLVPSQIRAVRLKRGLSQKQLADLCGMKQARISEMETAGACNYTIATLARIAAAVGIALQIEFCTFAEMLDWQNSYSQDSFDVTPITSGVVAEEEAGAPHE